MFEGIPLGPAIVASSPWVLLALTVLLLLTGRIVPRSTLADMKEDRDAWREAHRISEQARVEQLAQGAEMLRGLETTEQLVRALPTRQQSRGGR